MNNLEKELDGQVLASTSIDDYVSLSAITSEYKKRRDEITTVMRLNVLVLAHLLICLLPCIDASDYREHLVLRPLPQSALLAAFDFTSNTTIAAFEEQTYNLFPRSLGQILQHAHTKELHLRFALGRWDAANWGARPRGGRSEGGTGVEMWAWLEADTEEE